MWVTVFAWWALLVGGLATVTALVTRDQHWLVNVRRVTFITASIAIGIFAFAGAYVPAEVAPLLPLVLVTLAFSVASILIVDMRSGRITWKLSPHHTDEESLWRSVVRALNEATTLDSMLLAAASVIRRTTQSRMAVVHKTLEEIGGVQLVGAAAPDSSATEMPLDQEDLARLSRRGMNDHRLAEYRKSRGFGNIGSIRWAVIPVRTEQRSYATILLADPRMSVTADRNAQTLTTVSRLLGHHVASWLAVSRATAQSDLVQRLSHLQRSLSAISDFGQGLGVIVETIRGVVPVHYLSLSWLDRARYHEDRVSTMVDDLSVFDQRRRWPIWESTTATVLKLGRPLVTPDLDVLPEETPATQQYEKQLGMRSRLVLPIRDDNRVVGTLTLAHSLATQYGLDEVRRVTAFLTSIASWLNQLEHANAEEEYRTALDVAHKIAAHSTETSDDKSLLETILEGVDATGLRLYQLDDVDQTMVAVAQAGRLRDSQDLTGFRIPLSETPWHRWAMSERTAYRIDQSDPERLMDTTEAASTMIERMKTGWIVPIQDGTRILGFLDVMEARDPDRRSVRDPERLVLEAAALVYAQRWSNGQPTPTRARESGDLVDRITTLGGTVVNPITGIIGCVELIRQKQQSLTTESIKYLNMIENSATRIHEAITHTVESTRDDSAHLGQERATQAISQRLFGALAVPSQDRSTGRYSRLEPVDITGVSEG